MFINTFRSLLSGSLIGLSSLSIYSQDVWTYVGPGQVDYRCFAENEEYLYTGTYFSYGSVQRSPNQGETWEELRNGLPSSPPYVNRLLYADTTLYAGMAEGGGIYYRDDHSDTWKEATLPNASNINALMKAGVPWNVFLAGSEWGVIRSTDGIHWQDMNDGLAGYPVLDIILVDSVLYAASYYGVYSLQPGSTTWHFNNSGFSGSEVVLSLATHGNKMYAGTYYDGIYVSTDHGPWKSMNNGINIDNMHFNTFLFHQSFVIVGTSGGEYKGVFISQDEGAHWTEWLDGFPPTTQVLALHIAEPYIFAATSKGVFRRYLLTISGLNNILESQVAFHIYPSPTNGYVTISNHQWSEGECSVKCFNLNGRVVYEGSLDKEDNQLNLSYLPDGIYHIMITGQDGIARERIVISK